MAYTVRHLSTGNAISRPAIFVNDKQSPREWRHQAGARSEVESFHRTLPDYGETPLPSLPEVASELGLGHVFVKDESSRFGLPSFKILGASWAIHRALCKRLRLSSSTSLEELKTALRGRNDVRLVTCTEGNWGRASARMARHLCVPVRIYVPWFMDERTQGLLKSEGAEVILLPGGSYDDAVAATSRDASDPSWLMVMDTSWEGYEEVPQWVTDGYSTMLTETDRQIQAATGGRSPDLAFVSVGVGSWAHAVISHYMASESKVRIVAVESEAAPSLKESLHCGQIVPVETGETIMNGMNCGTTSTLAWPILRDGIHAAVTVADMESHRSLEYLHSRGVALGPCGAATLAALKKLSAEKGMVDRVQVVVLFGTEGMREYQIPDRR